MPKIKFTCNFTDSLSLNNRIINNYVTEENYDHNIIFTDRNDYDYLFVINRLIEIPYVNKEHIYILL